MTIIRRVAIYARFSTTKQDAQSIEDQERKCRAFAGERHWAVVQVYADSAQSGGHVARMQSAEDAA